MPSKSWHRASWAALVLLAAAMLLAACSGPSGGGGSSHPPPTAGTVDPAPVPLPTAPVFTPPASQAPSIAEQFIQRASLAEGQPPESKHS